MSSATPKTTLLQRNLFGRTIIGQKRERAYERQNVPFSFTIDVNALPVTPANSFVVLPDTYLFCNIPDDVGGLVITGCEVNFRDKSAASSSTSTCESPSSVGKDVSTGIFTTLLEKKSIADGKEELPRINLNMYVLDTNRRAIAKPVAVATLPLASGKPSRSAPITFDPATKAIFVPLETHEKINLTLSPNSSVMMSPSVASVEGLKAAKKLVEEAAKSANIVPTLTLSGYVIDLEEADEDAEEECKASKNNINVLVKRMLLKMGRQSAFTA